MSPSNFTSAGSVPGSSAAAESLTSKDGAMARYTPKTGSVFWSAQLSRNLEKIKGDDEVDKILFTINRPASPTASKPGVFGKEIRDHCENLTYDPDAPVPPSLAAIGFEKQASCEDVSNVPWRPRGPRKVDLYGRRLRDSIVTEGTNGGHARPFLTELSKKDKVLIESLIDTVESREQALAASNPPSTLVHR